VQRQLQHYCIAHAFANRMPCTSPECLVQGVFNKESMIMKLLQEASVEEVSQPQSIRQLQHSGIR
jgi:hypothetical protein